MKKLFIFFVITTMFYACKTTVSDNSSLLEENDNITTDETTDKDETSYSDDKYAPNPEGIKLSKAEFDMIVAVNKYREQCGRSILTIRKNLMDGARQQSRLMFTYGQIHWLSSQQGALSENIYLYAKTVQQAMIALKNVPGSNAIMLNPTDKYIGVGYVLNKNIGSLTQRFSH